MEEILQAVFHRGDDAVQFATREPGRLGVVALVEVLDPRPRKGLALSGGGRRARRGPRNLRELDHGNQARGWQQVQGLAEEIFFGDARVQLVEPERGLDVAALLRGPLSAGRVFATAYLPMKIVVELAVAIEGTLQVGGAPPPVGAAGSCSGR